ncbi:hypothetical protein L7F22_029241 [Adiantum nelumboides]|nr:hypothetical protein [Adiantum nelumboides]
MWRGMHSIFSWMEIKIAFMTPWGTFIDKKRDFGLKNTPPSFKRQETKVEELYDFIQACKCSLEEDRNAVETPVQEENAGMQETVEPCPPLRMHITNSFGSVEREELVVQRQGCTEEASCSRSPHVGDHSMSTLKTLEALGFSQAQVQRASDDCGSIDFDVLLNFLLDNKEVDPCINDLKPPEVDPFENEDCETATILKLHNLGFPYVAIKNAFDLCESHNFEVLWDVLNAIKSLKDEREVAEAKQSTHTHQGDESAGARLFNDGTSPASEDSLTRQAGVQDETTGAGFSISRISYEAEASSSGAKWTGSMEKLWCSYMGANRKEDFSPCLDSDDSEAENFQLPSQSKNLKARGTKRKLVFQARKEINKMHHQSGKMLGFGIPGLFIGRPKPLPCVMHGPPYFYFENVAGVPNNEWDTIKRHFNGVDPEFTDSKFFSASRRPRGYVHNLPIEGRTPLSCESPMTIAEAFPETQQYWPSWDTREKLNCINTRKAPDSLCRLIRTLFTLFDGGELPYHKQQEIVQVCKKWNLVWVGPGRAAPLEPHEIELVLGFDRDHTRGCSSMTERYDALGNSFQLHTVAYHLSPLKYLYPNGVTVLSLFSGIGGAEVALDKLGVYLKVVVAVEINEKVRDVLVSWWRKSGQTGELKLRSDVRDLTHDVLVDLVDEVGPIDLIIGGSPCNNLSGNNRVSRVGLCGSESSLFFEFPRILNIVTQVMRERGFL